MRHQQVEARERRQSLEGKQPGASSADGKIGDEDQQEAAVELPPRASIFLLCSIGSVHESAGSDELALTCYLDALRTALARLSHNDADMAVAYSHLGSACFHLAQFTSAARCFRVALSIRASILGAEHPDTAISHCSLGSSLCMLGPVHMVEAIFHLRKSVKTLRRKLGSVHPRTTMASRNLERASARPRKIARHRGLPETTRAADKNSKPPLRHHRYIFSERPRGLEIRDDKSEWRRGGQLPAVKGKPKKKGKKKGKGKKKRK